MHAFLDAGPNKIANREGLLLVHLPDEQCTELVAQSQQHRLCIRSSWAPGTLVHAADQVLMGGSTGQTHHGRPGAGWAALAGQVGAPS
jgi:hypothetical protein